MGRYLEPSDVTPLAKGLTVEDATIYIEDIEALAVDAAPCLSDPASLPQDRHDAVKATLRQAVLRWHRAGDGGLTAKQQSAGPFAVTDSFDTRNSGGGRLYPSEERKLREMCREQKRRRRGAFSVMPR